MVEPVVVLLMRFFSGPLDVTIKYTFSRGHTTYYQRAVPTDLLGRYPGKTIKIDLKTSDPVAVARLVTKLNRQFEAEWAGLRAAPESSPAALVSHAKAYLDKWGLRPQDRDNDLVAVELFRDHLDDKRGRWANGDDDRYNDADPAEYLTPVEDAAARLLFQAPRPTLSSLRDVYLSTHTKRDDAPFRKLTNISFDGLIAVTGDKAVEAFTRADVRSYVEAEFAKGNKTGTIRRRLNVFVAAWSAYAREEDPSIRNPFERLSIPGEGADRQKRDTFTAAQLNDLLKACKTADDDPRWLFALMMDTGARIGEAVGLTLDDLRLDAPVPYMVIQPHPWRTLKTRNSSRELPLVGASLWAAQRIHAEARAGQLYAFPRYTKQREGGTVTCSSASASATLVKWLRSQGVEGGVNHELRHTMNDRLREVRCPKEKQQSILGHGGKDTNDGYGRGHSLSLKLEWLEKVALTV